MQYFNIFYHYQNVSLNAVKEAVKGELSGPQKLFGYREIHLKIKQKKTWSKLQEIKFLMSWQMLI